MMNLGEALIAFEGQVDGEGPDAYRAEVEAIGEHLTALNVELGEFLEVAGPSEHLRILGRYIEHLWAKAFGIDPPDEATKAELAQDRLGWISKLHRGEMAQLPESVAAANGGRVGDKWVSPGRLVLSWPDLDLTALAVALVMAAHGNDRGENIWISQRSIGDYLGRDRTTIYRAIKRLEKVGVITMTAKPRQHKPATYRINRGPRVS